MPSQLFIIAITCYLVSLVATLTGSFFIRLIPSKVILMLTGIHFILLFIWIVTSFGSDSEVSGKGNFIFLACFCMGIIISAIMLRSGFHTLLKIYFSIFLISLPVFVIAPSRLLGFIVTGNFKTVNPQRYHLSENYYLVEQGRSPGTGDTVFYKLIREMGLFHATLSRNIMLPVSPDSVTSLRSFDKDSVPLRVYFHRQSQPDSFEILVSTAKPNDENELKQVRNHK